MDELTTAFGEVAENFDMRFALRSAAEPRRVLISVSKLAHCLNDLLFRARVGELPVDVWPSCRTTASTGP